MTRPVAEILAQAQREGWPTSSIDAMANHHLCGTRVRDYVNECFAGDAASPREDGQGGARSGCGPHLDEEGRTRPVRIEGTLMSRPTPEELKQLRDAAEQLKNQGKDTSGIDAVIDLVTGVDGPQ